jgi:hypothetical protein
MRLVLRRITDWLAALVPSPVVRYGLKSFAAHPALAERAGFQIVQRIFWSPLPNFEEVDTVRHQLPDVAISEEQAQALLDHWDHYSPELADRPFERWPGCVSWLDNGTGASLDAAMCPGVPHRPATFWIQRAG